MNQIQFLDATAVECHEHNSTPHRIKLVGDGGKPYALGTPGVEKSSISLFSSRPAWRGVGGGCGWVAVIPKPTVRTPARRRHPCTFKCARAHASLSLVPPPETPPPLTTPRTRA